FEGPARRTVGGRRAAGVCTHGALRCGGVRPQICFVQPRQRVGKCSGTEDEADLRLLGSGQRDARKTFVFVVPKFRTAWRESLKNTKGEQCSRTLACQTV